MSEADEARANEMAARGEAEAREQTAEEQERDARLATFIRAEVANALKREGRRKRPVDEVHTTNARRSEKIGALAVALAKAQGRFEVVKRANTAQVDSKKGAGSSYGYKYAELGDFMEMAKGPLSENGLAVMQVPTVDEQGCVVVETILVHGESDQWIASDFYLVPNDHRPQSIGSAVTYARRYAYTAILGMISDREDDDGNRAQGNRAQFSRGRGDQQEQWGHDDDPYGGEEPPPPGPPQQPRNRANGAPQRPQGSAPQQPPPKPAAGPTTPPPANTPEQVKERLASMGKRPEPDEKGPDDLKRGLEAIKTDFHDHEEEAVKVLVDGYGADPSEPWSIGRGSYKAAHDELTKLYKTLRRSAGGKS